MFVGKVDHRTVCLAYPGLMVVIVLSFSSNRQGNIFYLDDTPIEVLVVHLDLIG